MLCVINSFRLLLKRGWRLMRIVRSAGILLGMMAAGRMISSKRAKKHGKATDKPGSSSLLVRSYSVINRYVEWHKLPTPIGLFNLMAFRKVLREKNLYSTLLATRDIDSGNSKRDV